MFNPFIYFADIPRLLAVLGSLAIAINAIYFIWGLAHYIFSTGDDMHRAHAKLQVINGSITLFLILLAWWICEIIYSYFV